MQKASAHARSTTTPGSAACVLRYRHSAVLPSVGRKTSAPRLSYAAQYLACALPCECFTSALADNPCITRGQCVRYSFTVTDFHRLPLAGLPAHPSTASTGDIREPVRTAGLSAALIRVTLLWLAAIRRVLREKRLCEVESIRVRDCFPVFCCARLRQFMRKMRPRPF